ncbi:MAG: lysylphosphatidylglycerol synthase transmembrane domain-containing protein [Candidatus Altimarinota bacterium]
MKKKIAVLTLALLGASIFVAVLVNTGWREIWALLYQMTFAKFLLFLGVIQISYAIHNWRWQIILRSHGHEVSFWSLWIYRASGYGVSYLTPTPVGGEPVRIYFLTENHGISLRESTASVFLDKLIELSCFALFVASGVFIASLNNLLPDNSGLIILVTMSVFIGFFAYVFKKLLDNSGFMTSLFKVLGFKKIKRFEALEERIYRTEKLMMDFLSHTDHKKTTVPFVIFLSFLGWSATILEYYFIGNFLGFNFSNYESFLIATVPSLAYLLPIPGGFGVLEGLGAGMFVLLGYSASAAIAVMVMVRLKELFFSAVGFLYSVSHGVKLVGKGSVTKQVLVESSKLKPSSIEKKSLEEAKEHVIA